jgi:hypothetical protein
VTIKFGIKAWTMLSSLVLALVVVAGCQSDEPATPPASQTTTPAAVKPADKPAMGTTPPVTTPKPDTTKP